MIKDFIINAAMLVAFISISHQVFRNTGLNHLMPLKSRILSGAIFGLLGVTLIVFGISLPNNLMIDFRPMAIFLATICGGWVSTGVSIVIIAVYRVLLNGINMGSVTSCIILVTSGLVFCFVMNLKIENKCKWLLSIAASELISCTAFSFLIKDMGILKEIIILYCLIFSIIAFVLYYYTEYLGDLTESYRRYKKDSKKDFLTGLNNVRQFENIYKNILEENRPGTASIALLYIDIDFFKRINDTYGHLEGDLVLKKLSQILINSAGENSIVSRIGGEEFSILLRDSSMECAGKIAEAIRRNIETTFIELSNKERIKITVSIGVASCPESTPYFRLLKKKADEALYEAKGRGRNKIVFSNNRIAAK